MKIKSRLSFFIVLLSFIFSMTSLAASWQDYGNYDIQWYNSNDLEFNISTPAQLAGVAYLVNNGYTDFKSKNLHIVEDLNLSGRTWAPIGTSGFPFRGNIDGGNKVISGIDINKNSSPSPYVNYGFLGDVENANICNLNLRGNLNFKIDNYFNEQYLGGLAAKVYNSEIKNCYSELEVCYDRDEADNFQYLIYVGGLVGYSENNKFEHCCYRASLRAGIGGLDASVQSNLSSYTKNSNFYLGGFCAYDDSSDIKYCSVEVPEFILNVDGSPNSVMGKKVGSIMAYSRHTSMHHCRAIVDDVVMKDLGSKASSWFFNGLSDLPDLFSNNTKDGIYNCYSVVRKMEFVTGTASSSSVYYGGISAFDYYDSAASKFKSNYSNSDYYLNSYSIPNYIGYMGLTTFDSKSMKTKEFCDELNLYFTLNGEDAKWVQGDDGYPIIMENSHKLVESITITPDKWEGVEGDSFKIEATVMPEDATVKDIVWSSSDEDVASVSETGLVTILKEGICVITATAADDSSIKAECLINAVTAVDAIFGDDSTSVDVFTMSGVIVARNIPLTDLDALPAGLYIVRQGTTTRKIAVK